MPHTKHRKSIVLTTLAIFALLSTACGAQATPVDTPTPTLLIITATLPPTETPRPSATPEPPTPTVPVEPVAGQTTSQLNVRSAPSAESDQLGTLQIFQEVQIVGKDPAGAWWLILFPDSPTGTGWITAQFVQVTGTAEVPVFEDTTQTANNTPAAATAAETGAGPTVPPGSASPSPAASAPPAQSLATAFEDGDSYESPAVSIALSKATVRGFNYNSDISSPTGDPEDWIQFRLEGPADQPVTVSVIITCTGSGPLSLELVQNNSVLQGWQDISCARSSQLLLNLFVSAPYYLHLAPVQAGDSPTYIDYTLIVTLE